MHQLALVLQSQGTIAMAHRIESILLIAVPIIIVVFYAIVIVPFWFICKKAGFSPWLSLLNIVPMGNLILIYVLAFAQWKVVPVPQMAYPPYPPRPPYPQPPLPPPQQ